MVLDHLTCVTWEHEVEATEARANPKATDNDRLHYTLAS